MIDELIVAHANKVLLRQRKELKMTEKIEYETIVVDEADGKKTVMRVPKFPASYDQMARIAFLARGPYKCTCNPHTTKSICTKCGGLK